MNYLTTLANLFPFWVVITAVLALIQPEWFTWFDKPKIIWGLGGIMLGMGMTLKVEDFVRVARTPRPVALGFLAQFSIMPMLGWGIAKTLQLPPEFAAGLILVSCCPGGTASNVVTFIAKAHLPLSLLMTMCSTFGAVILTPSLTEWLASTYVNVDGWGLFRTTATVVLLPVVMGVALHHLTPGLVRRLLPVAPLVSVILIALICASIMGDNRTAILEHGKSLVVAVASLHVAGFGLGYLISRIFGYEEIIRRTIAIEVGMQNSGLGTALAKNHFTSAETGLCLAAVPCAMSAVFHSVIGSVLAGWWRIHPVEPAAQSESGEDSKT